MKLVRYGDEGCERPGLLDDQGMLRALAEHIDDIGPATLDPDTLKRLARLDWKSLPIVSGGPRLGPCVGGVGKFVCIGLNYRDHALEAGMSVPAEPVVFMKATSCICGPNDPIVIPRGCEKTDWEVELGVVIGRRARDISAAQASAAIAGYCIVNDVSERAWQLEHGGLWDKGKSFDHFGPIGPWLVSADEVEDPQKLDLWLDVNGNRMQTGSTRTMIFDVPTIVSYLSRCMTLHPGDVISTGTPPGVGLGKKPPVYLKAGDRVRLGIRGLGVQEQLCVAEEDMVAAGCRAAAG